MVTLFHASSIGFNVAVCLSVCVACFSLVRQLAGPPIRPHRQRDAAQHFVGDWRSVALRRCGQRWRWHGGTLAERQLLRSTRTSVTWLHLLRTRVRGASWLAMTFLPAGASCDFCGFMFYDIHE